MTNAARWLWVVALGALLCVVTVRAHTDSLVPVYTWTYGSLNVEDFFMATDFDGSLASHGWTYHGYPMYIYDSQVDGTVPLYRFYSPVNGKHFYTTWYDEVGAPEWTSEGITGYIFTDEQPGTQAIHRWHKWVANGPVHLYVFSDTTQDNDLDADGWLHEGIIGYTAKCTTTCY